MTGLAIARGWAWPRLPFEGLIAVAVGTLLLAGAIHVCAILLVPSLARTGGWSRLAAFAGEDRFIEIPAADAKSSGVPGLDPLFVNGACRLQLGESPAGVTVEARERFWSLALYDPRGTIIFSLNDRTAIEGQLDMVVVNPEQNAGLSKAPTEEIEQTIVVESQSNDLIALLRLFAPTRSAQLDARRILAEAECLPAPSLVAPQPSGG